MNLKSLSLPVRELLMTLAHRVPLISDWRLVAGAALSLDLGHRIANNLNFVASREGLSIADLLRSVHMTGASIRSQPQSDWQKNLRVLVYEIEGCVVTFAASMPRRFGTKVPMEFFDNAGTVEFYGIQMPDRLALFDAKCIAAMTRVSATDLYDLWWMTHKMPDPYPIDILYQRIAHLIPRRSFADVKERLTRHYSYYKDWDRVRPSGALIELDFIETDMRRALEDLEMRTTNVV